MRKHERYDDEKRARLFAIAKQHSPKAHALVQLLYEGALRIQDVVGIPFAKITLAVPDADGFIEVEFVAKKSTKRQVLYGERVQEAVEAYREHEGAPHDAVMFASGDAATSSNALINWLTRFFKRHGETVQSHDFRKTMANNYYDAC